MGFVTGLQGGVSHNFDRRCHNSILPYLSHSSVVIPCESAPPCRTAEKEGDESDPPQKSGGHVTPDSGAESHASIRPMRVALVLIYPCGKARKAPPGGALKEGTQDL